MSYGSGENERSTTENKFRGVRRRKWGKWVSEIRVPGTKERLWLGTYSTPEAAAMAHDVAFYCLKRPSSMEKLNFPAMLPSYCVQQRDMSPRSVQKVASDAGMALDAQRISGKPLMTTTDEAYGMEKSDTDHRHHTDDGFWWEGGVGDDDGTSESRDDHRGEGLSISIEDYTNLGVEDCPLFW